MIPGGIRELDIPKYKTDDGTCSRCGEVDEADAPLLCWNQDDPNLMYRFCGKCMGWEPISDVF